MVSQCLQLAHNCLNFDFMGTSSEESADDMATIQIPTIWRSGFLSLFLLLRDFLSFHLSRQSFNLFSTNLPTNLSTNPYTNISTNLSTNITTNLPTNLSTNPYTNISTNLSTNISTNLPTHLSSHHHFIDQTLD